MSEQYTLLDLLNFLMDQRTKGYQGINVIIEILELGKQPLNRRFLTTIAGLRSCGLYETGFIGDRHFEPKYLTIENLKKAEILMDRPPQKVAHEMWSIKLSGQWVRFNVCMN